MEYIFSDEWSNIVYNFGRYFQSPLTIYHNVGDINDFTRYWF